MARYFNWLRWVRLLFLAYTYACKFLLLIAEPLCNIWLMYIPKKNNINDRNGMWKGDSVGYISLHEWVNRRKPRPKLCECCKKKPPIDLANISQEYKRDVDDWEHLCRRCHMIKDGRLERFVSKFNYKGRRKGTKLSKKHIEAVIKARSGFRHTEASKRKISRSRMLLFKKRREEKEKLNQ